MACGLGQVSFSTEHLVDVADAFDVWVDGVRRNISRLEISSNRRENFRGAYRATTFGPILLTTIEAAQQHVCYKGNRDSSGRDYEIVCMRGGEATFWQDGERALLRAGDTLLLSKFARFEFLTSDEASCTKVSVSKDWLRTWLPDPDGALMQPVSAEDAWANLLSGVLRQVEVAIEAERAFSTGLVIDQIGGAIGLLFNKPDQLINNYRRTLQRELIRTMRSQLFDLDLSPRKVADHHRISIRYVHSLFGSTGTTFGTELRAIRLKRFREMLTDPAFTTKRISELALRCGYRDSAYLSQVFKEEFGKTPTEFRLLRAGMH